MVVRAGHNFACFVLPKSGSTTVAGMLRWSREYPDEELLDIKEHHFAVVRNPYERALSCWWWGCFGPQKDVLVSPDFRTFGSDPIGFIEYSTAYEEGPDYWIAFNQVRQLAHLVDIHQGERIDFVIRLEDFPVGAEKFVRKRRKHKLNSSPAKPHAERLGLDMKKFRRVVNEWAGPDFDYGYEMIE